MRWLVTVDASADSDQIQAELAQVEAVLDKALDPIPMSPDEMLYFVEGPTDLAARIVQSGSTALVACYPDSEQTLYDNVEIASEDEGRSAPPSTDSGPTNLFALAGPDPVVDDPVVDDPVVDDPVDDDPVVDDCCAD